MANYIFDKHYGSSSLADPETDIVIEWENGRFNETQKAHTEGTVLPQENPELYIANKLREMGEYILKEYPELV